MRRVMGGIVMMTMVLLVAACGSSGSEPADRTADAAQRYSSAASPDDALRAALGNMMALNSWRMSGSGDGPASTIRAEVQASVSPRVIYTSTDSSLLGGSGGSTEMLLRGDELLVHTPKENEEFAANHPGLTADTWLRVSHDTFRSLIDISGDPYFNFGIYRDTIRQVAKLATETIDGQAVTRYRAQVDPNARVDALLRMNPSPLGDAADLDASRRAQIAKGFPSEIEFLVSDTAGYVVEQSVGAGPGAGTSRYSNFDQPLSVPEPAHIMDKNW